MKNTAGTITINMIECGIENAQKIIISDSGSVMTDGGDYEQCRATAATEIRNVKLIYILFD